MHDGEFVEGQPSLSPVRLWVSWPVDPKKKADVPLEVRMCAVALDFGSSTNCNTLHRRLTSGSASCCTFCRSTITVCQ
jgi:hypothetical protein